jgi:hypothetical protein
MGEPASTVDRDPWRHYMRRTAERLRRIDPALFEPQIARIEACLERDANWNLESAVAACERWRAQAEPADSVFTPVPALHTISYR